MKKCLVILAYVFITVASAKSFAQGVNPVPANYKFDTAEDYPKYETDIIKTVDWLQQQTWRDDEGGRQAANAFVLAWLTGTKSVNINVDKPLIELVDKNPDLLIIYMGNYAKYMLEHKEGGKKRAADKFALQAMADKYVMETSHVQSGKMDALVKANMANKLDDWMDKKFYKSF